MKIIDNFPSADYHSIDAASASRLKSVRRSLAHCKWQMDHPEQSPAMAFGEALHTFLLEFNRFESDYEIAEQVDRRTTAGKKYWSDLQASGKPIVTREDFDSILAICGGIKQNIVAWRLLGDPLLGRNELSCFWRDAKHDIDCKMRADRLVEVSSIGPLIVDLKTTTDASPEAFTRSIDRFGYHIQGAHYMDGLAACGIDCVGFCIVAVEKDPPYGVAVYRLSDDTIEQGRRETRRLLAKYAKAVKTGVWGGYSERIEEINLPAWAFDEEMAL